jgi:sensor domain CHASE-containing protein/CheY-like chemotaxis protein
MLLAAVVVIAGWSAAERQARASQLEAQRAAIANEISVLRVDMEGAVNGPIQLVRGLVAVIATEPDIEQARFAELASNLIAREPSLRNIAAAPDMIIRMIYPVEGNEQALGLDYRSVPAQREAALRSRDIGELVLAGPVDLVQGGQGFIGRFPVFLRNDDGQQEFWGLVSAVMDMDVLYEQSGLDDSLPFSVTLIGRDATGSEGVRFYGPEISLEDEPVIANVSLPAGSWQIAALPLGGWTSTHPMIWTLRFLLLVAATLILVPSIIMGRSMRARQTAIDDLEIVNTELQRQMKDLQIARTAQAEAEVLLRQSQKLEAVGQLTGGIAHDFNNLLTVIMGNAEMLASELSDRGDLRKFAEMTVTAAERGSELTHHLLAFSRKQTLKPRTIDVQKLIDGSLELLVRRTLPETIGLHTSVADDLWLIEIDPSQLESALLNIILNARDAMPNGGDIEIQLKNTVLNAAPEENDPNFQDDEYVMIEVRDTGHGMSEDTLLRVYEPFFTTKEVGRGSGLGLSMVYGFVKQSGGQMKISSSLNNGTSVTLYFPRSLGENSASTIETGKEPIMGASGTILVVEDDSLVREHVRANLIGLGYTVLEAENGQAALDIIRERSDIDLLFTDVVLPGNINGKVLADSAKELRADLKVLFTSGYTEDTLTKDGRLGAETKLLRKPYRRNQLAAKIREVLGN